MFEIGSWLRWEEFMPTDWAGVVGFQPCDNARRADSVFAREPYLNLDSASITRESAVSFQAYAAAFVGIVHAVLQLEKLVEEYFGHSEKSVSAVEILCKRCV